MKPPVPSDARWSFPVKSCSKVTWREAARKSRRLQICLFLGTRLATAASSDFAGAIACQKCHAAEYAAQQESSHAVALAPSKPGQPGEWAFGAGTQAITFVSRKDADNYLEHGMTWYRKTGALGLTPGHHDAKGVPYRIFDPSAAILRCFSCHSTGQLSFSPDESIVPHELGVRCEACHGPAGEHARDPSVAHMDDPKLLTADQLNTLCGQCHRMPAAAGDATNLRNPWNARHQPLLLAASRCFRESQGKLSCVTCHSPHARLERGLAKYDAICAGCHRTARHTQSVAGQACAGCHMPRAKPQETLAFTNHRIAVYAPSDPMAPLAAARQ